MRAGDSLPPRRRRPTPNRRLGLRELLGLQAPDGRLLLAEASLGLLDIPAFDGHAHVVGGASDDAHGGLDLVGVEVGELGLGNLLELIAGDGADLLADTLGGALGDARSLLDEDGGGRGLEDEGEGLVLKSGGFGKSG